MKRTAQILMAIPALLVCVLLLVNYLGDNTFPIGWKPNTNEEKCIKATELEQNCLVPDSSDPESPIACANIISHTGTPLKYVELEPTTNCVAQYNSLASVINAMTGFFIVFYAAFGISWASRKAYRYSRRSTDLPPA